MVAATASGEEATAQTRAAAARFAVEIGSLAEAEAEWRLFETEAAASPYQRFDWIRAYGDALEGAGTVRVARVRAAGRLVAMMALTRDRRLGLRLAVPVGRKHVNLNQPLVDLRFLAGATPDAMAAMFRAVGRAIGADVVAMPNSPVSWGGLANPFAAAAARSPSDAYGLTLASDPEAVLTRASSAHARKKLRNKERGLAKLGTVSLAQAATAAEAVRYLEAFFEQKSRRFEELGIDDPYGDAGAQAFVRAASLAGLERGRPAIELHALTIDGRILAVIGSAADPRRLSGMFISFDASGPEARFSLGEILVSRLIEHQCRGGRAAFDLGIGEARYKQTFCDEALALVDIAVPVTPAGVLYCWVARQVTGTKRRLKRSPRFMRLLAAARRLRAGRTSA